MRTGCNLEVLETETRTENLTLSTFYLVKSLCYGMLTYNYSSIFTYLHGVFFSLSSEQQLLSHNAFGCVFDSLFPTWEDVLAHN